MCLSLIHILQLKAEQVGGLREREARTGLAVSLFRDNSTRTRFSFSKAANLLGLELQDLDEKMCIRDSYRP